MNNDIFETINRNTGERVPDGYFDDFKQRMTSQLPEREWVSVQPARPAGRIQALWNTVRPYAYLAAMFAGIACMMNLFDLVRGGNAEDITSSPTMLAALDNETFVSDYISSSLDEYDLYEELYEAGFDPSASSYGEGEIHLTGF